MIQWLTFFCGFALLSEWRTEMNFNIPFKATPTSRSPDDRRTRFPFLTKLSQYSAFHWLRQKEGGGKYAGNFEISRDPLAFGVVRLLSFVLEPWPLFLSTWLSTALCWPFYTLSLCFNKHKKKKNNNNAAYSSFPPRNSENFCLPRGDLHSFQSQICRCFDRVVDSPLLQLLLFSPTDAARHLFRRFSIDCSPSSESMRSVFLFFIFFIFRFPYETAYWCSVSTDWICFPLTTFRSLISLPIEVLASLSLSPSRLVFAFRFYIGC